MFILAAYLLTAVAAFPAEVPVVALVPPGTTVNMTFDGPTPTIMAGGMGEGFGPDNLYHRTEFQFLDFQMNQTAPLASNLMQNIEVYTNITFGPHFGFPNGENLTEGEFGTFTSDIPTSVDGYIPLYSGMYNGNNDNKVNIDRTLIGDTCGIIYNRGYMDVWVRPTNPATAGAFRAGYYTCFFDLNFGGTIIIHEGESQWSGIFQCNSGNLNNYSFRLWYQYRIYNIDHKMCQVGNFHSN